MMKTELSEDFVGRLTLAPVGGRYHVHDELAQGLAVEVSSRSKRFIVRRGQRYDTLGTWPAVTVAAARSRVGMRPSRGKLTLQQLLDGYLAARPNLAAETVDGYRRSLQGVLGSYMGKRLEALDGQTLCTEVTLQSRQRAASVALALRALKAIWRYGAAVGWVHLPCPVELVSAQRLWPKVIRRRTVLTPADLAALGAVLREPEAPDAHPLVARSRSVAKAYVETLVLTGGRRTALLEATGSQIRDGVLMLPTKRAGVAQDLPLGPRLQELLGPLCAASGPDGRLFGYASRDSARKGVAAVQRASGVHFTPHDLRRTFITVGSDVCGLPDSTLKELVGHSLEGDVTHGYKGFFQGKLRAAAEHVQGTLVDFLKGGAGGR